MYCCSHFGFTKVYLPVVIYSHPKPIWSLSSWWVITVLCGGGFPVSLNSLPNLGCHGSTDEAVVRSPFPSRWTWGWSPPHFFKPVFKEGSCGMAAHPGHTAHAWCWALSGNEDRRGTACLRRGGSAGRGYRDTYIYQEPSPVA